MKVFVGSGSRHNSPYTVNLDPSDSIECLKARISEREHINPADQTLLYGKTPLQDTRTLQSYGIQPESTIHIKKRKGSDARIYPDNKGSSISKNKREPGISLEHVIRDVRRSENLLPAGFKDIKALKENFEEKVKRKKDRIMMDGCSELGVYTDFSMSVSVSGDSQYAVSGGNDGSIKIFNLKTKKEVFTISNAHEDSVRQVVFTNDSQHIVSCSDDLSIKIFNFKEEQVSEIFCLPQAHEVRIMTIAVSHDNKYVASACKNGTIKVFSFGINGSQRYELKLITQFDKVHTSEIRHIVLSKDNKYLVSASNDTAVKLFDLESKQEIYQWENAHKFGANAVAISSDNKYIVSAGGDGDIKVYEFESKQLVHTFTKSKSGGPKNSVNSLAISADSKYLVTGSDDFSVTVFDLQMKHVIQNIKKAHQGRVSSITVSPNNNYVVSCGGDNKIKAFELELQNEKCYFKKGHPDIITSVAISNDNKYMITGSWDKSIKIFDINEEKEIYCFENIHKSHVNSIALSNDNRYIISGSADHSIKILEIESREEVFHLTTAHQATVGHIAITSDDRYLVSADYHGVICVMDFQTRTVIRSFTAVRKDDLIYSLAVSNNNCIAICSENKKITLFDFEGKQLYCFEKAQTMRTKEIRITSDNKYLLAVSEDKSVKVFDLEVKEQVYHWENAHDDHVLALDVSKDGKYFITGSKDKSIKIFSLETKAELCHIQDVFTHAISKVRISNDSKYFVSASYNGDIKVYNFPFSNESWALSRSKLIPPYLVMGSYAKVFQNITDDSQRLQNMTAYQDLLFMPYNWNILHVMAIFEPENISKLPDFKDMRMPYLVDIYKKTPLHYLLAQPNLDYTAANALFEYILDYTEDKKDNLQEYNEILSSLTNLFPFIISKTKPSLRDRFLSMSIHDITYPYNEKPPRFGKEESQSCFSKTSALTSDILKEIHQDGESQVSFSALKLNFDYHPLSDDMLNATIALSANSNENVFKSRAVSHLIDHLWNTSWTFHCVIGFFFSALMILMSVYIGLGDRSLGLEITMLILCIFFLASEYFQVYNQRLNYLNNIWNWADLSYFKIFIATIIVRFCDADDDLSRGWLYSVLIILGYVRWMSYFQLFGPTRKLIQFIRAVIWDMWGFVAILAFITIGFALIFLEYDREQDYLTHVYATYNILYGNDGYDEFSASQKIMLSIISFFFTVVLLNLLVSLMGGSHEKVQEEEVLTESHVKLDMILESTLLMRLFSNNREERRGYLMFCEPSDEQETDEKSKLDVKLDELREIFSQHDEKVNEMQENLKMLEKQFDENYNSILKALTENK